MGRLQAARELREEPERVKSGERVDAHGGDGRFTSLRLRALLLYRLVRPPTPLQLVTGLSNTPPRHPVRHRPQELVSRSEDLAADARSHCYHYGSYTGDILTS